MKILKAGKEKNQKEQISGGVNQFAKYSGLAFQMGAIIFVTVWGGQKLDAMMEKETQIFTITLSLLGVFVAIYVAIKDFIKINK